MSIQLNCVVEQVIKFFTLCPIGPCSAGPGVRFGLKYLHTYIPIGFSIPSNLICHTFNCVTIYQPVMWLGAGFFLGQFYRHFISKSSVSVVSENIIPHPWRLILISRLMKCTFSLLTKLLTKFITPYFLDELHTSSAYIFFGLMYRVTNYRLDCGHPSVMYFSNLSGQLSTHVLPYTT